MAFETQSPGVSQQISSGGQERHGRHTREQVAPLDNPVKDLVESGRRRGGSHDKSRYKKQKK